MKPTITKPERALLTALLANGRTHEWDDLISADSKLAIEYQTRRNRNAEAARSLKAKGFLIKATPARTAAWLAEYERETQRMIGNVQDAVARQDWKAASIAADHLVWRDRYVGTRLVEYATGEASTDPDAELRLYVIPLDALLAAGIPASPQDHAGVDGIDG